MSIQLIVKPPKNKLMERIEKLLTRKPSIIDQLNHISLLEQSRYCSPVNFWVNVVCRWITHDEPAYEAYTLAG